MAGSLNTNAAGKRLLARIHRIQPFLLASLSVIKKRCGRPSCRCAKEGPRHEAALLTWKEEGRTRAIYVPREMRQEVARWIKEGKLLKRLLAQMSQAQREFFASRKPSRQN
jgi:hypothetical protein